MEESQKKLSWWEYIKNLNSFDRVFAKQRRCEGYPEEPCKRAKRCAQKPEPTICPEKKKERKREIPGLLRYLHDQTQLIMPQYFQGATLRVQHTINEHWKTIHSITFSQICPGGYRLKATYTGDEENKELPFFMIDASPEMYANVEARAEPFPGTRATVIGQLARTEILNWECFLDAYWCHSTASIITANREMLALHYMRALTGQIAVGAELAAWAGGRRTLMGGVRFNSVDGDNVVSLSVGHRGMALCLAYRVLPAATLAARVDMKPSMRLPVLTLGYEYRGDGFTARSSLDTDGVVGGTLERSLGGSARMELFCAISALYNHANEKFDLGFGAQAIVM